MPEDEDPDLLAQTPSPWGLGGPTQQQINNAYTTPTVNVAPSPTATSTTLPAPPPPPPPIPSGQYGDAGSGDPDQGTA